MVKRLFCCLACCVFSIFCFAQKLKTVSGEYTYVVPENVNIEQAKQTALERVQTKLIAEEFGTSVTQINSTSVNNINGQSDVEFISTGGSEVKGEWIETIGEPVFNTEVIGGQVVVTVSVKGKIREIVAAKIDLRAKILRNGTEDKFESQEFRDSDDLYVSLISPIDGFLAIYLVDANNRAYCLLPYRNQADGIYQVKANRRYVFFSERESISEERQFVEEYVMTCERAMEQNTVYFVFSQQPFGKAVDNMVSETLPRELDFKDFTHWLAKCKRADSHMVSMSKVIILKK